MSFIPPQSFESHDADQRKMLQALSCAVAPKSAVYISGPITTGLSFVEWYQHEGSVLEGDVKAYSNALRNTVVHKNEEIILELAEKTRRVRSDIVIEPASLYVKEWEQSQYIGFWIEVLRTFVKEIIVVENWQYSAGCAAEFSFAIRNGCAVYSHQGEEISASKGWHLILDAAKRIDQLSSPGDRFSALAASLRAAIPKSYKI